MPENQADERETQKCHGRRAQARAPEHNPALAEDPSRTRHHVIQIVSESRQEPEQNDDEKDAADTCDQAHRDLGPAASGEITDKRRQALAKSEERSQKCEDLGGIPCRGMRVKVLTKTVYQRHCRHDAGSHQRLHEDSGKSVASLPAYRLGWRGPASL